MKSVAINTVAGVKSSTRPIRRVGSGMFSNVKSRVSSLLSLRNNKQYNDDDDDDSSVMYDDDSDNIE